MLKALLRGFEMASGLKVNFSKSCLIGINVDREFMDMACNFLNCNEGTLPFKYLGLPVGANPSRMSTWDPLLEHVSSRLNSWGNKFISFGGRIVLLNAVINAIPIFYLSFLKMPGKVWRNLVRIQREFLWGGVERGRKINWVKWRTVCQPKGMGGLGVRDIRVVNLSLLAKWRWRLLNENNVLWKEVLGEKYVANVSNLVEGGTVGCPRLASRWWKDIINIEGRGGMNWFNEEVVRKVGNGSKTNFWHDIWRGGICFRDKYPRLFAMSTQKEATVAEVWVNGEWRGWHRAFFVWEEELLNNLLVDLYGHA